MSRKVSQLNVHKLYIHTDAEIRITVIRPIKKCNTVQLSQYKQPVYK